MVDGDFDYYIHNILSDDLYEYYYTVETAKDV